MPNGLGATMPNDKQRDNARKPAPPTPE